MDKSVEEFMADMKKKDKRNLILIVLGSVAFVAGFAWFLGTMFKLINITVNSYFGL